MKSSIDLDTRIAFSVHSSPGVYALLLGSGISKGAGILTGTEIVVDLIKKIDCIEDKLLNTNKFNEVPDYAKLLDMLTITKAERRNLLHQYFEPDKNELDDEVQKVPTLAHKSIARLVKCGYLRMILTTNFDRLLETALQEEGVPHVVISTEESLKSATPYVHNRCTIIKLHGDYMDANIKNTPKELAYYSKKLNKYLGRVFDEFGLIICCWSADCDTALRQALSRRKNGRFSTYWTVRGQLGDEAIKLINEHKAEKVPIKGADEFFSTLSDSVEAIEDFGKSHPLSTDLAVARVKKYLSEDRYSIKLQELVKEELDRVYFELLSDNFKNNLKSELPNDLYIKMLHKYEELMKTLIKISTTLVYYENGKCLDLINKIVEGILRVPSYRGNGDLTIRQLYPVLLLSSSIGLISLESSNYGVLATILSSNHKNKNLLEELYRYPILEFQGEKQTIQQEDHIETIIKDYVGEYLLDNGTYYEVFDIFEYLVAMMYIDCKYKNISNEEMLQRIEKLSQGDQLSVVENRLAKKYYGPLHYNPQFIYDFINDRLKEGEEWSLLKSGFFNSSSERMKACLEACKKHLHELGKSPY
jgi:hypothetical protein